MSIDLQDLRSCMPLRMPPGEDVTGQPYDCDGLGSAHILELIPGLSYRQLDYWTRSGRLTNHQHDWTGAVISNREEFHSGNYACWYPDQVKHLRWLVTLLRCGFSLVAAEQIATDRQITATVIRELTEIETDLLEAEQQGREQLVH